MTPSEFRAQLLIEQFAYPTPEWHPSTQEQAAAERRAALADEGDKRLVVAS